jgi:peptide/nickel transport system permease protein
VSAATVAGQPLPVESLPGKPEGAAPPRPWLAQAMFDTVGRAGARLGLVWIGIVAFLSVFAPFIASSHPYLLKTNDPLLVSKYGAFSSPLLRHLSGTDVTLVVSTVAAVVLFFNRSLLTRHKFLLFTIVVLWTAVIAHWKPLHGDFYLARIRDWPNMVSAAKARAFWAMLFMSVLLVLDVALIVLILVLSKIPTRPLTICLVSLAALTLLLVVFPVNPPRLAIYEEYREAQAAGSVQFVLRAPLPYSASDRLRDQFDPDRPHPWRPSPQHLLGTELYGADVLSRMTHASRIAMSIGFIATGIAVLIGAIVGGLMGYFVGWVDLIGMRLVEIFGSIPTIYLLLAFVAFFERNLYMMMVIIGLTTWVGDARFVRAEFLKLRNQDFVHAARAAGLPLRSVLFRHMLPNAMAPLLVSASFGVAWAILYESTLSFLGLGLVDQPSWGQLLNQAIGQGGGDFYWWLATFPGLAIFLTVFAYNLIGEAARDALDPKLKKT